MNLYVDSCVYIDFLGIPKSKFDEIMSNKASKFFSYLLSTKHKLLLSGWVLKEINKVLNTQNITLDSLKPFFVIYDKMIVDVKYTEEDKQKAITRSKDNFDDVLHIVLAEKANADYIITQNVIHFKKLNCKIPLLRPEEFISQSL